MANVIIGLAEKCYEGVLVIRGYATSKLLIKYSKTYPAYQRDKTPEHVAEIKKYIEAKDTVFMPEIILSYDYRSLCPDEPKDFFEIFNGRPLVRDNINGMAFRNLKHKSSEDKIFKVELPIEEEKKPFFRIDGNHRLEAMAEINQELKVPYCIVLFCSQSVNADDSDVHKHEMSIFHNINAKGKILSTEEQYKGLFNIFNNDELDALAPELTPVKKFAQERCSGELKNLQPYLFNTYPNLRQFFDAPIGCLLEAFRMIKKAKSGEPNIDLHDILSLLNTLFGSHEILKKSKSLAILGAYVFWAAQMDASSKKKIDAFTKWVCSSQIYSIEKIDTDSLIDVFCQIYNNQDKKIFVAMPFDPALDFVWTTILRSVKKINRKYGLEIPEPIRMDKQITGSSYDILQGIFDNIKDARLLIADLTDNNANVYYEAGYAQGVIHSKTCNTTQILYLISNPQKPDEPFEKAKLDLRNHRMIPYKNTGNGQSELEKALVKELKVFYKIQD